MYNTSRSSFFNGISTFVGWFNAKAILREEQQWYYLTRNWEDKGVHTFPKGICPNVNVIARREFELAYYDSVDQRFNHYTTLFATTRILCDYTKWGVIPFISWLKVSRINYDKTIR